MKQVNIPHLSHLQSLILIFQMTPWVPILATMLSSDFLSIPCCAWDLDAKFERRKVIDITGEDRELKQRLGCTGTDGQKSAYAGKRSEPFPRRGPTDDGNLRSVCDVAS
jgi:hypothetical protein